MGAGQLELEVLGEPKENSSCIMGGFESANGPHCDRCDADKQVPVPLFIHKAQAMRPSLKKTTQCGARTRSYSTKPMAADKST